MNPLGAMVIHVHRAEYEEPLKGNQEVPEVIVNQSGGAVTNAQVYMYYRAEVKEHATYPWLPFVILAVVVLFFSYRLHSWQGLRRASCERHWIDTTTGTR